MPTMRQRQHAKYTGGANRTAAVDGLAEWHDLVLPQEQIRVYRCRCCLATIVAAYLLLDSVVMQQESATAEARGLRLNQPEHQLHGDSGVHRAAAVTQNFLTRLCRQRIRRHRHESLRTNQRLLDPCRGRFGRGIGRLRLASQKRSEWREQNQSNAGFFQLGPRER